MTAADKMAVADIDLWARFLKKNPDLTAEILDPLVATYGHDGAMKVTATAYGARPVRRRATKAEMAERRARLVELTYEHGPCSVRHIFYQALVVKLPGITKSLSGYGKVQRLLLELRRSGAIPYRLIVDSTRWMRWPDTWGTPEEALRDIAALYRRDLWAESGYRVEAWCESESIASTIVPVTYDWCVPLLPTRGQSSETFAYSAAESWREEDRQPVVLYVGDHDPAGLEIEANLANKLRAFTSDTFNDIIWERVGVTWEQVVEMDLVGEKPKKPYGYPLSVEAEALPPRFLCDLLAERIASYAIPSQVEALRTVEAEERDLLLRIVNREFAA